MDIQRRITGAAKITLRPNKDGETAMSKITQFPTKCAARAWVHEDKKEKRLYLQIDLANDFAITLSYPTAPGADPAAVTLYKGGGQSEFGPADYSEDGLAYFRLFAEVATGRKTYDEAWAEYEPIYRKFVAKISRNIVPPEAEPIEPR
jgi:hypothetical protein